MNIYANLARFEIEICTLKSKNRKGIRVGSINKMSANRLVQCLKFTEKVSFNTASEASYVYIF